MSTPFQNSVLNDVTALIEEINGAAVKTAAHKKAEEAAGSGSAAADPGGHRGKTSHPSGKADGGLHAAPIGFRGKENTEDVKKDIPHNVEDASAGEGDSDYDHVQVGTKKSPTGGDPSTENAYKGDKEDPGTEHPADANDVGEKYSAMHFPELYKLACDASNRVLSRLANDEKITSDAKQDKKAGAKAEAAWEPESAEAAAAGYELAKIAAAFGQDPNDEAVVKFAAAQRVVHDVLCEGVEDADAVGEYLYKLSNYNAQFSKQAEGEDPMAGGMPPGMAGGMPPGMGGGDPMAGGMPAGGDPTGGEAGLADAEGGGGGEPGGGEGGGDEDSTINELANAFVESGLPVDKLIAALQAASAGGGGGDPAAGGGGDPAAAAMAGLPEEVKAACARLPKEVRADVPALLKIAGQVRHCMASGRFKLAGPKNAKTAAERAGATEYLKYLKEVFAIG